LEQLRWSIEAEPHQDNSIDGEDSPQAIRISSSATASNVPGLLAFGSFNSMGRILPSQHA
jgi:hypothetical protein